MLYGDHSLEEFTELLKAKDRSAFSYLYDVYSGPLYGVITSQIPDHTVCNNILVKVFLKVWNQIDQYDQNSAGLFTWMHQLTLRELEVYKN
ncbi:MAG: hypothetical protein ABI415_02640 [Flavitalea sp.]